MDDAFRMDVGKPWPGLSVDPKPREAGRRDPRYAGLRETPRYRSLSLTGAPQGFGAYLFRIRVAVSSNMLAVYGFKESRFEVQAICGVGV